MDGDTNLPEGLDLQSLAAQMLGLDEEAPSGENEQEEEEALPQVGHPAWQEILSKIPVELHNEVLPTLQSWDSGVSRRFQKIHDEYEPYKELEKYGDPETLRKASEIYQALIEDPVATVETIRRVYGLSPEVEEVDEEYDELPPILKEKLSKLDEHERALAQMRQELEYRQAAEQEAQEDAALEEYLEELTEEYGEFDQDYVVGLIAAGVDGEEAVARYQYLTQRVASQPKVQAPTVMSGSGGIPSSGPRPELSKLSNTQTQDLVAELLRMTKQD